MRTDVARELDVSFIPFEQMGSFPRLFVDYCAGEGDSTAFFGGHFRNDEHVADRIAAAQSGPVDRGLLVDVLSEQNETWRAGPATFENIERLSDPRSVCVVTGQQLGLFVSPLYTIYKTLTVIRLARAWSERFGIPVVPIFWLADEDHDFDEVATTFVPGDGEPLAVRLEPPTTNGPVGRHILDNDIQGTAARLSGALDHFPHASEIAELLDSTYQPQRSMGDAFASLLHALLRDSGIVIMSGDDARLKAQARDLMQRDITDGPDWMKDTHAVSKQLAETYHAQVKLRWPNLFLLSGQERVALDATPNGFKLRDGSSSLTKDALLDRIQSNPVSVSPNVILRPLFQDTVLPNAAYVGGPGEVSYYAQLGPVYGHFGVSMPVIVPRASISLVDRATDKLMLREQIAPGTFMGGADGLFADLVRKRVDSSVNDAFTDGTRALNEVLDRIKVASKSIDATLAKSVEATRVNLDKEISKLEAKVLRAEKRQQEDLEVRVRTATALLAPFGKPQERVLSPLYFAARFGLGVFEDIAASMSIDMAAHQVIQVR